MPVTEFLITEPAPYFADPPPPPPAMAMSGYEENRIRSALDALPEPHFREAIEFSAGVTAFTRKLAMRCERLVSAASAKTLGSDFWSPRALPARRFDLIVFSDVLTAMDENELDRVTAYTLATLAPRRHCLLVHWLHSDNGLLTGDAAAERFIARAGDAMQPLLRRRMPHFRVDLLERV